MDLNRRTFIRHSTLAAGSLLIPIWGRPVTALADLAPVAVSTKKKLADAALNAATKKGASYVDVRIGRYLNQFLITREQRVENTVSTESYGAGIRVLADGCWGFYATDQLTPTTIAKAAEEAVAIAKANARAKMQDAPVELAPEKGLGEVTWKSPIKKSFIDVPISEKVALLMDVNNAALQNGANFINSFLFQVNEQKYFASTDGSYIDQDIHRIWPNFIVTAVDPKTGKFETRRALSAPCGRGYEYLSADPADKRPGV